MLYDASDAGAFDTDSADAGGRSQPLPTTGHRTADDFLSLPELGEDVPIDARYRWRTDVGLGDLILSQFTHGPLLASDVENPSDARNAFDQAFAGWLKRQKIERRFIEYAPVVLEASAVRETISDLYGSDEFCDRSQLYMALQVSDENFISLEGFSAAASVTHPLLVPTVLSLLDRASGKTAAIRTPGWFLEQVAMHYWQGDELATDAQAREELQYMYEGDDEAIARFLPSAVRPDVYPDAIRSPGRVPRRRSKSDVLTERELVSLRKVSLGWMSQVCDELLTLTRLIHRNEKRTCLRGSQDGNPIYSLASVSLYENDRIGEILDDHYNYAYQGSDNSYFNSFIPLAAAPRDIVKQYEDWVIGFRILNHVDRLLVALAKF